MQYGGEMPGFGKPGSVTRGKLVHLPLAMQAEGVRLLLEMGCSHREACRQIGASTVDHLLKHPPQPFQHESQWSPGAQSRLFPDEGAEA